MQGKGISYVTSLKTISIVFNEAESELHMVHSFGTGVNHHSRQWVLPTRIGEPNDSESLYDWTNSRNH